MHWGQRVTGDHIVAMDDMGKGIDGSADAFIVTDLYSGLRAAYPAPDKSADSITMALRMFIGSRKVHKLDGDRSGEISKTLKTLGICLREVNRAFLRPMPWLTERMAKCSLERDGCVCWLLVVLGVFGSMPCAAIACSTTCAVWTTRAEDLGVVPTDGMFRVKRFHFGANVLQATTDRARMHKFADPAIVGVFAVYDMTLPYGWSGIYFVWRLEDLVNADL